MTSNAGRMIPAGSGFFCNQAATDLTAGSRDRKSERGVSIVETVIALAVLVILTSGVIYQFTATKETYNAEDAANRLVNYFREANSRAISDHHSFRVVINLNSGIISMIDEQTSATGNTDGDTISGDDVLVKQEPVATRVSFTQPSGVNPPASPFNFSAATFTSSLWTGHFQSDGRVTATFGGAPVSSTFFLQPTDMTNMPTLIRAVTLTGPTGSIRYWMYNGSNFIQG